MARLRTQHHAAQRGRATQGFFELQPLSLNADRTREGERITARHPGPCRDAGRITYDQAFGSMLVVGLGGVLVEVFKDVVMRPAPIDVKTGREMVGELNCVALLKGARGIPPADLDAFVAMLVKLSELAHAHPDIREMDINPVMVYPDGLMAVDARVALNDQPSGDALPANGDRSAARRRNLEQAISPRTIVVIGDKQAGGYIWLRAQSNFKGNLYSVQIDPKEIPNIEKMGITNYLNLSEVPGPVASGNHRRAAPGRADDSEELPGYGSARRAVFHLGLLRNGRRARNQAGKAIEGDGGGVGYRAGRSQLHGTV